MIFFDCVGCVDCDYVGYAWSGERVEFLVGSFLLL